MNIKRKNIYIGVAILAVATLVVMQMRPDTVPVDYATAGHGPLQSTVNEEGVTRVRQRFLVTSPIAGRLRRIALDEGDSVSRGEIVVHVSPQPLDARAEAQARGRRDAADALALEARAGVEAAAANLEEAQRQQLRAESLAVRQLISTEQLDLARLAARTAEKTLESAEFRLQAATYEAEVARAALLASGAAGPAPDQECIEIPAPIDGKVLRVHEENERVVLPGTALIEFGDPTRLEIVVDLLSTDAVKVKPGATMLIEDWGGEIPLRAVVRRVEPSGFTKVSALGVEEQRVNVLADFIDPPTRLGDGYRVETKTVLWEGDSTLTIPWSALVRRGAAWGVYAIVDGQARWRDVEVGHRGEILVEILSGLTAGNPVIVHPGDDVADGVGVSLR